MCYCAAGPTMSKIMYFQLSLLPLCYCHNLKRHLRYLDVADLDFGWSWIFNLNMLQTAARFKAKPKHCLQHPSVDCCSSEYAVPIGTFDGVCKNILSVTYHQ